MFIGFTFISKGTNGFSFDPKRYALNETNCSTAAQNFNFKVDKTDSDNSI